MLTCPKCHGQMEVVSYGKKLTVDRCVHCHGIWFDKGEAEALQGKWMSESLDSGDPAVGKLLNDHQQVDCPRCSRPMLAEVHKGNTDIIFEACPEHGIYFDAGEFSATQYEELMSRFKSFSS